ncbi:MAG: hypothetical protein HY668_02100 [Chloroflexi bacterium]|nr:hypothetical protein [Chloroflexota bacterium]
MAFTHKQRILAASRKEKVDKLPFGARIDLWYNYNSGHGTLPAKYRGKDIRYILKDQGAGVQVGHPHIWKEEYRNTEVIVREDPPFKTMEYRTPKGTLSYKTSFTPGEGPRNPVEVEKLFKSADDYPAIEHLLENMVLVPNLGSYPRDLAVMGEDGIVTLSLNYSPMQEIMRRLMGFDKFFFELADHPNKVEHLYELMKGVIWQKLRILCDSPVAHVPVCANWIDSIHTPVFKKYFVPWFQEVGEFVHSRGKLTTVHIDGEMKRLIPMFLETGIDIGEAWTPAPMTSVTTAEIRKAWGDKVVIWGGVPAILFEPQYSDDEFDAYVKNMFKEVAPGYSFIVGLGDNLPPDGKIERIGRIAELIDKYGRLPIKG